MERDNGNSGSSNETLERVERSKPYVLLDGIKIIMDEMAWAANMGLRKSLTAVFRTGLVEIVKESIIRMFFCACG